MCACPNQQVIRAGFLWREFSHKQDCSNPSPDTLVGYYLGANTKGETTSITPVTNRYE